MSAAMQVADWIPGTTLPVREGVYEVLQNDLGAQFYAYWDGVRFSYRSANADHAYEKRGRGSLYGPPEKWRGVRRWVLQIPALFGPGPDYLISVSRRGVIRSMARLHEEHFPKMRPMTFDTKEAAVAYAMSKRELRVIGWKAVLP